MSELRLALEAPRWAARFYARHWPVVVGLSLVGSVQRLVAVNWGVPDGLAFASEVVVMAARVALVVVVWRLAMRDERPRWANVRTFVSHHWPSLVWQAVLLGVAFLVADVVLERVVGDLLFDSSPTYLAVLLFVKNPTVIAYTFVWWIGLIRQAAVSRPAPVG
ncbi:hypothetical protein [Saccharothrix syringae]|uniref:Uncharacterized protein n=1 Tax=Saccharothrix syringae TaxID=103733 RepID=A0A5Q0HAF6_SACSY|nr:hypothetical protein [Saccharothrix syringae]QFZ23169.1 hypothetical protein EKG83_42160 [Saccharothrix syringae]